MEKTEKNKKFLKKTIQAYLIKQYIIKMITCPIEEARRIKIQQFAVSLMLCRIEKNLRKIFIKARVNFRMKQLRKDGFVTYALLCHKFKQYVKKRRARKNQ